MQPFSQNICLPTLCNHVYTPNIGRQSLSPPQPHSGAFVPPFLRACRCSHAFLALVTVMLEAFCEQRKKIRLELGFPLGYLSAAVLRLGPFFCLAVDPEDVLK